MSIPLSVYRKLPKRFPHSLGFSKYCMEFDSSLFQYIDFGNVLNMGTVDFVLEAWFKTTSTGTTRSMVRKRDIGAVAGYELGITNTDEIYCFIHDGTNSAGAYDGLGIYNDGEWHHVVALVDRDNVISLYIDGGFVATSPAIGGIGNLDNAVILSVGSRVGAASFWDGYIDEVKIYRGTTMTPSEIRYNRLNYHTPIKNGLQLWVRMEEGAGLTAYDLSGNNYDGTLNPGANPPTWTKVKKWELRAESEL